MAAIWAFSPLLVGVLSETRHFTASSSKMGKLSVPYWSGCSVKHKREMDVLGEFIAFSPLLVGVLSETAAVYNDVYRSIDLSVPYWSGCSVKHFARS